MTKRIEHIGVVRSVDSGVVRVEITSQSACASCKAREACGMGESTQKIVDVATTDAASFTVGEDVVVAVTQNMGLRAVVLAYFMPLVVLLTALILLSSLGLAEGVVAVASLGATALYFFMLYGLRGKIDKKIKFIITKQ